MKISDTLFWLGGIYGAIAISGFLLQNTDMFRISALFSVGSLSGYLIMRVDKTLNKKVD
jgi:mannitol-specific phosphotransferase system IIBC component